MPNTQSLEQARNALLSDWLKAKNADKAALLVKIMDIEDQLELDKNDIAKTN